MVIFLSFSDRTKILFGGHAQTVNGPLCYTSFKIFTCLNRAKKIKKNKKSTCMYINWMKTHQKTQLCKGGKLWSQKCLWLTWPEHWQTRQTTNNHQPHPENDRDKRKRKRGKRSKRLKTNMSDVIDVKWQALCETNWRVYPYLLLPTFQYQHHRKHIRCFPSAAADSQRKKAQTEGSV